MIGMKSFGGFLLALVAFEAILLGCEGSTGQGVEEEKVSQEEGGECPCKNAPKRRSADLPQPNKIRGRARRLARAAEMDSPVPYGSSNSPRPQERNREVYSPQAQEDQEVNSPQPQNGNVNSPRPQQQQVGYESPQLNNDDDQEVSGPKPVDSGEQQFSPVPQGSEMQPRYNANP